MTLFVRRLWLRTRYSFWFIPAVYLIAAVALAVALIELDERIPPGTFEQWPRVFGSGPEGARGLLTAIASSMITVAGVVFSITLVALSLASSQYTSRVLRNFLSDRVTQFVLGAFVGIFAYCLVVLRTIRATDEFTVVPSVAVLVGLLLGFFGIVVLIYFIHHISTSIQASHIMSATTTETLRAIDHLFPEPEGVGNEQAVPTEVDEAATWHPVAAARTGYLQSTDMDGLLAIAGEHRTVLRLERRVGQFVVEGEPLASMRRVAPNPEARRRLQGMFDVGRQRTVEQDAAFGVRQIVDMALKALSPGVNDTTTAVMCVDQLTAILARLAERRIDACRHGEGGELRLIACGPTFADLVGEALDQIRQSAGGNHAILERLLESLELLAGRTIDPRRRAVLLEHALAVTELGVRTLAEPRDRRRFADTARRVLASLGADASKSLAALAAAPLP